MRIKQIEYLKDKLSEYNPIWDIDYDVDEVKFRFYKDDKKMGIKLALIHDRSERDLDLIVNQVKKAMS
jgi:uncharacterized protein YtpQ (UPF0354 family)